MDTSIKVYSPKEAFELCKSEHAILLDISDKEKLSNKKYDVPKQINISDNELDEKWIILPLNKLFIVADTSGIYASKSAIFLKELGFKVAILAGGIVEWEREGLNLIEDCKDSSYGKCNCHSQVCEVTNQL